MEMEIIKQKVELLEMLKIDEDTYMCVLGVVKSPIHLVL